MDERGYFQGCTIDVYDVCNQCHCICRLMVSHPEHFTQQFLMDGECLFIGLDHWI